MVTSNKILSSGIQLAQNQGHERGMEKRNDTITILLTDFKKTLNSNSEPNQTSKLKPLAKAINGFKLLTIFAKSSTSDIQLNSETRPKLL